MSAYYNEIDPYAAQWLRNLIAAGHIAPGDVDERSIEDVRPDDLRGYTQCHFFAGIGVWSYALRRAGWPDDRPVWTGSCPCQPFSAAGKGSGFDDERHLWPTWFHLIGECRPAIVFGEQVAGSAVEPWIDLVQADVEAMDYAFGCVPFPSAGVNAPHIRDRAYWLAYAQRRTSERQRFDMGSAARGMRSSARQQRIRDDARHGGDAGRLADTNGRQRGWITVVRGIERDGQDAERSQGRGEPEPRGAVRGMADPHNDGRAPETGCAILDDEHHVEPCGGASEGQPDASPTNSFWRDVDWLLCRDGKWRPVEPGTFPLVDGAPARVGRLRAYGNAINAEAARAFIETCIELI
ncbi:DNA cytosine methyltransferase [Burkholderia glumae]|uniref:DNA cytosine methyltransferase n=1 Tax=Burkholderia glumae TaxID=337 RepID=UPI0020368BEA|nr:DNA cytosine methyltransferase [Burkholderia glumae]MCM2546153.1 DNA cytosine methyltransferase [Burkholderia glumae]